MNYVSSGTDTLGARKVDVTRGANRGEVSAQWASRPDDQKFLTLQELFDSVNNRRMHGFEKQLSPREMRFKASREPGESNKLTIELPDREITPTHYSFGQLCALAKAPASYLRGMHGFRAAFNLQADMIQRAEDKPVKLYGDTIDFSARAFTGPDYGRIYDADLVASIQRFAGDGSRWKVPGQIDWRTMSYNPWVDVTKDSTTLYASDRDVFLFLVDDTHPIEVGKLPNGDPDLIFRGFYAYNSEVGARSLGIATFWLRAVCQNRNLWGVEDFDHLRIVHSKHGNIRFEREAAPALERYARSEPTKLIAGITAAKQAVVARNDEERIAFLHKEGNLDMSLKTAMNIIATCEREEGKRPQSIWDFCQGITAVARDLSNQDNRIEMEKVASKLMGRAARNAV
jgi:hypothetical protein